MDNDILNTYEILGKIGEGSGGTIYKAYHKRLGKMVVLKRLINPKGSMEANKREVNILKNLNHSYLPHVIDFLETDAGVFTVMSYVPGKSFQQLLRDGAEFPKESLLKWAMQICSALNYLHNQPKPIIHGDIKPSNIMLTPQDDICIIDFNISTFLDEKTVYGCTKGFASPEQFMAVSSRRNKEDIAYLPDVKTDIYSVGATLYHMATGKVRTDYAQELDMELLTERLGSEFAGVIEKATELDPKDRYQSAYEMFQALKEVPEKIKNKQQKRKTDRKTIALITVACVLVIAAIGGGMLAFKHHQMNVCAGLVQNQKECISNDDFLGEQNYYNMAIDKKPHEAESYYWHAYADYICGDYEGCVSEVDFAMNNVRESSQTKSHMGIADLYALKGSALLAQNENEKAVEAFENANSHYPNLQPDVFRQYATALARVGRNDEAWNKLDEADRADGGKSSPQSDNTRGEIKKSEGNTSAAASYFEKCINALKKKEKRSYFEEGLLCNSYVSEADMLQKENVDKSKSLMRDAAKNLALGGQIIANRKLGSWDYNTGDYKEAIQCFEKIIGTGKAKAADYEVLGEAYAATHNSSAVRKIAAERLEKTSGGNEDFYYYRLMALAEAIDIEQGRSNSGSKFYRYYELAQSKSDSSTSSAMEDLGDIYEKIRNSNY